MDRKYSKLKVPWFVKIFLVLILFIGFIVYKPYSSMDTQDNSVLAGLRGNVIFIIQKYPSSADDGRLWIGYDGQVTYGKIDANLRKNFQLDSKDTGAINTLQKDWCSSSPLYPELRTSGNLYEIGVRCDNLFSSVPYKKIKILSSNLPSIFKIVLSQFPEMN